MSHKKCWCFPEREILTKEYREQMKDCPYLGKKTTSTIINRLADKNVKSYEWIPFYAQSDYEEHMCTNSKSIQCRQTRMSRNADVSRIEEALRRIAKSCECKNE
jgi:hypothetical protein